jgi:predicted kinase
MNANKKNLYLMVGAPGSGKSTYLEQNTKEDQDYVISRDAVRYMLIKDGDSYFSKEKEVFKTFIKYIQESIDNPATPKNIYCDATHITEKSRNKVLDALNLENVEKIICLVFRPSLEETLRRNKNRTGRACVPESAIKQMYLNFERPEYDTKYPKDVRYIEVPK